MFWSVDRAVTYKTGENAPVSPARHKNFTVDTSSINNVKPDTEVSTDEWPCPNHSCASSCLEADIHRFTYVIWQDNRYNCGRFVELNTVERARLFVNADTHACSCLYAASKLPWCNRDYCPLERRLRGFQSRSGHSGVNFWPSQESNPTSRQRRLWLRHPGLL